MEELLLTDSSDTYSLPDYAPLSDYKPNYTPIPGGRIRITRRCGEKVASFRSPVEAKLPVRNLYNPGSCTIEIAAVSEDLEVLKSVSLRPGERLSVFAPPAQTMYLLMAHYNGDGCPAAMAILECDDIPRV